MRAGVLALALAGASATCDAPQALTGPGMKAVAMRWELDTLLVAGTTVPAPVTVTVDGEPYARARLRVTSSDTTIVAVSPDGGSVQGRKLGVATLTVRLLNAALPAAAPMLVQRVLVTPKEVRVSPLPDTLRSIGDTVTLSAIAFDAADEAITDLPTRWTSSDTAVAVVSSRGLVTARGSGDAEIRADVASQVTPVAVHVRQRATHVLFTPSAVQLDAIGATADIVAQPLDARGNAVQGATALAWSSAAPGVASAVDARVTALDNGAAWVRVTAGPLRDSVHVDVLQRATRVVVETPDSLVLRSIGETAQLRARGYDARGNEVRSGIPLWRSQNQLVAYVEPRYGLLTGIAPGTSTLIAEQDGVSDSIVVSVNNVAARVVLDPAADTLVSVGDTLQLRWSVRNALGDVIPGATVSFGNADAAILRVLATGQVIAVGTGSTRVVATSGTVADTSLLTVINAVAHVDIAPTLATLASVGDSLVPPVTVTNERGAVLDRTAVAWTSNDVSVARVTATGIVIATGSGEAVVRATSPKYPDRADSLFVTVTNAPASVSIGRAVDTLSALGRTRTYAAEVRNARGALLSTDASWRTTAPLVATVNSGGTVTAVGAGQARIIASAGALADTVLVTVQDVPVTLELTPAVVTLVSLNDTLRLTAAARNEIGSVVRDPSVTWHSTDSTIVRALADGRIIAIAKGSVRIVATSGYLADTALVTVTNEPVLIDILDAVDTLVSLGDSLRVPVIARNARGDAIPRGEISWGVDDPVVARVSTDGMVTARDTGRTWVRAAGGLARDSVKIVVRNEAATITITMASDASLATLDTMTAIGQSLRYVGTVRNASGALVPNALVSWRSTVPAVASIASTGTALSAGYGTTLIIARAGLVEDTARLVVADPRRIYVDNSVSVAQRFGTIARPFARIQDAVDAAGLDDTVIVWRGTGYSEAVTLGRRVTLLGDSAAFVAGGRDPLLLPRIAHDLGIAGISASTAGSSYTIRYLAIQHSVDGDAIAIRDAVNAVLEHIYVNPVASFRTGRGILLENVTGAAVVARSRVDSVYGYGVLVRASAGARVDGVTVRGVGARSGSNGAGVELSGGANGVVANVTVRRTAGPQVLLGGTTSGSVLTSTLAGEQQLLRLTGVSGLTMVQGNTLDLRRQAGDPAPVRGASALDPSGIELTGSSGVVVDNNGFTDVDGRSSLMDGVRIVDSRAAAGGPSIGPASGAVLTANRFRGGRTAVRSERSTWRMTNTRSDSAGVAVQLAESDTVTLDADTLVNARTAAVQSTGLQSSIDVAASVVAGPQRAVVVTGASRVAVRGSTISGAATGASVPQPTLGAVDLSAGAVEVVGNSINGMRGFAGLVLRGGTARVDTNVIARNVVGVRIGAVNLAGMRDNALFDNDTLPASSVRAPHALIVDNGPVAVGANWWGDGRGPRRAGKTQLSAGDSVAGSFSYDSLAGPIAEHAGGTTPATMRMLMGDGQSGAVNALLPVPLSVRVVDAAGRPIAGASVLFRVTSGGGDIVGGVRVSGASQRTMTTDASGIAEVRFTLDSKRGTSTLAATAGTTSQTFTLIVP